MELTENIKIKKRVDGVEYPFFVIKNEEEINNKLLFKLKKELDSIDKKGCIIYSQREIKQEESLDSKYDNNKYRVRIVYVAKRNKIKWSFKNIDRKSFNFFRFDEIKSLQRYSIKLYKRYCKNWSHKINLSNFSKDKETIRKMFKFLKYDYFAIKSKNMEAFLILYFKIPAYNNKYCDLIGHIEICQKLKDQRRKEIHELLKWWLNKNSQSDYIVAEVDSFNTRSQRFFRKMGFKPKWLAFIKENF